MTDVSTLLSAPSSSSDSKSHYQRDYIDYMCQGYEGCRTSIPDNDARVGLNFVQIFEVWKDEAE